MDAKSLKIAYIALASVAALGAIVAALFRSLYLALGLIVLASAILLGGSYLFSRMFKLEMAAKRQK